MPFLVAVRLSGRAVPASRPCHSLSLLLAVTLCIRAWLPDLTLGQRARRQPPEGSFRAVLDESRHQQKILVQPSDQIYRNLKSSRCPPLCYCVWKNGQKYTPVHPDAQILYYHAKFSALFGMMIFGGILEELYWFLPTEVRVNFGGITLITAKFLILCVKFFVSMYVVRVWGKNDRVCHQNRYTNPFEAILFIERKVDVRKLHPGSLSEHQTGGGAAPCFASAAGSPSNHARRAAAAAAAVPTAPCFPRETVAVVVSPWYHAEFTPHESWVWLGQWLVFGNLARLVGRRRGVFGLFCVFWNDLANMISMRSK